MPIPRAISSILKIGRYTLVDHLRQKSFIAMFLLGAAFVFFTRSCYHGNYLVNGLPLGAGAVAAAMAKMSFHAIALAMMILAALLAMRAFSRDRDHGMQACIMAKPITRTQYVAGKIVGLWTLAFACMFVLHAIVFSVLALQAKVFMPAFLASSLLCSLNLLTVVAGALFLALLLPDFVAFMTVAAVIVISFVSHGVHALNQSQMLQMTAQPQDGVTWTTVMYYLWPKISELQIAAATVINPGSSCGWSEIYAFLNISAYGLVLTGLLLWRFKRAEIL